MHSQSFGNSLNSKLSLQPKDSQTILKEVVKKKSLLKSNFKKCKTNTNNFIDHSITIAVLGVITIYALLADDIRQLAANKKTDIYFDVITFVVFTIFMVEILLSVWAKPKYFLG